MSKYIDEIIKDLKTNPETYKDYRGCGVEKGNIRISGFGNTCLLSVIKVKINDKDMPTSHFDLWCLESAIKKWYNTMSLSVISA